METMGRTKADANTFTSRGLGPRARLLLILIACIFVCLLIAAGIGIVVWRATSNDHDDNNNNNNNSNRNRTATSFGKSMSYAIGSQNVTVELKQESTNVTITDKPEVLSLSLAVGLSTVGLKTTDRWLSDGVISLEWRDGKATVDVRKTRDERFLSCMTVKWTMPKSSKETVTDCIDTSASFWFGGFEESYQHWPVNKLSIPMSPFVTGDAYSAREIGDVIEPLLVSSLGFGVYVQEAAPLYILLNHPSPGHLCLRGRAGKGTPFFQKGSVAALTYHVCRSTDVVRLWKEMTRVFVPKPEDIPSPLVFRQPIWSTWAVYKGYINQSKVLDFADDILNHGFGISQLEIDDNWTPKYGDFTFDLQKFPDARTMISILTTKAIPVTVWMHPFFNIDSDAFEELAGVGYLIKNITDHSPALTSWWRGGQAGILDVTNPNAVDWYLNRTAYLKARFNVTSFKFDAGEVNWLPDSYAVKNKMASPNQYSQLFAQMAYQSDTKEKRQETRVGFKTQNLPILVRMIDRDSSWSHQRGLKSLIPTILTFSIMGYHFTLPDMIGGNAYDPQDMDRTVLPDAELFVRWLQATTFMPTLQFSVPPWLYNNATILNITRTFVDLHASFSDRIVSLARNSVTSGEPIVRPLWWIAPNDPESLVQDSQFLLGNDVLVAPVLDKGTISRDVYLPSGRWRNGASGKLYVGPVWLVDFPAPLDTLPYFYKV